MLNDSVEDKPSAPRKMRRTECTIKAFPLKHVIHGVLIGATYLHTLSAELLYLTKTIVKRYIYIGKRGEVHHCATFEVSEYRNEGKRSNLSHKRIGLLVNNSYTILYQNCAKIFQKIYIFFNKVL